MEQYDLYRHKWNQGDVLQSDTHRYILISSFDPSYKGAVLEATEIDLKTQQHVPKNLTHHTWANESKMVMVVSRASSAPPERVQVQVEPEAAADLDAFDLMLDEEAPQAGEVVPLHPNGPPAVDATEDDVAAIVGDIMAEEAENIPQPEVTEAAIVVAPEAPLQFEVEGVQVVKTPGPLNDPAIDDAAIEDKIVAFISERAAGGKKTRKDAIMDQLGRDLETMGVCDKQRLLNVLKGSARFRAKTGGWFEVVEQKEVEIKLDLDPSTLLTDAQMDTIRALVWDMLRKYNEEVQKKALEVLDPKDNGEGTPNAT